MPANRSAFARIEILPAEYADKILSAPSVRQVRVLYNLVFPLLILAGVSLLAWAGVLHGDIDGEDQAKSRLALIVGNLAVLLFFALLVVRLLVGTKNRWLRRVARREVLRRPDRAVNPDAPGVRFVELVPKSNWNDPDLVENADEAGFLAIDLPSACLLYEGDNERYRIPAGAMVKCEQDAYTRLIQDPYSKGPNNKIIYFHFVVVTVKVSDTMTVELPFRIRKTVSLWSDQKAREANYELLRDLNHLKHGRP